MLKRYKDISFVLSLEFKDGITLIKKAIDKDTEEKLWQRWLVDYSNMDKKNFLSFEEYKKKLVGHITLDNRSQEEIIEDIIKSHKKEVR